MRWETGIPLREGAGARPTKKRKWVCCELVENCLREARARFAGLKPRLPKKGIVPYRIFPPCSVNGAADGGFKRPPRQKDAGEQSPALHR